MKSFYVVGAGGEITFTFPNGDTILQKVAAGVHSFAEYQPLVDAGASYTLGRTVRALDGRPAVLVETHPSQYDTGANPDFTPTFASRQQLQMAMQVQKMAELSRTTQAQLDALQAVAQTRADAAAPVIETTEPAEGDGQ